MPAKMVDFLKVLHLVPHAFEAQSRWRAAEQRTTSPDLTPQLLMFSVCGTFPGKLKGGEL